jgi:hypothetical protein
MDERVIPEYSASILESKANYLLRRCGIKGDFVDVDFIAEAYLDLEIIDIPNLEALYHTQGILWKTGDGEYKIVIDKHIMDRNPNRYRTTVAEEIAHFILHKDFFENIKDVKDAVALHMKIDNHWHADRNAKRFAAALLMPPESLRQDASKYYEQIVETVGFGDPHAIKRKLTSLLAKQYQVSFRSMEIRLGEWPVELRVKIDNALLKHLPAID